MNPLFEVSVGTTRPVWVDLVGVFPLQCGAKPLYVILEVIPRVLGVIPRLPGVIPMVKGAGVQKHLGD